MLVVSFFFKKNIREKKNCETKHGAFFICLLGRRVAAFGYMAGFAGAAVGIDVWCHQKMGSKEKYGALTPYPNEEALISFTKERLSRAGK